MIGRARRQGGQAGTTLVELVVSVAIIGLALTLLVGAFSTGVIQSTLVKRNTAVDAALGYELERIAAATYTTTPGPYSECFAVDSAIPPAVVPYQASCPPGSGLRADVTESAGPSGVQQWTVQIDAYPSLGAVGTPISVYKIQR